MRNQNSDNSSSLQETSSASTQRPPLQLNENDYDMICHMLMDTKRQKWQNMNAKDLEDMFTHAEKMNTELTGQELTPIIRYLNLKLKERNNHIHHNLRKSEKINAICEHIGNKTQIIVPAKVNRSKSVKPLSSLCIMELQRKSYPKDALAVSYARSYWPCYKNEWFETASVAEEVEIEFLDQFGKQKDFTTFMPAYSPAFSRKRRQLEVRVMDGTHIRTNVKSKLIRHGLENVKIQAWKKVATSGITDLLPAMLEVQHDGKIMHQQCDPYVRTMFSEKVEKAMIRNDDLDEAKFCRLFREWHEAEDKPGISSQERVERSLRFRDWLLEGYEFGKFPPPSLYVRGIPRITFEGLICSIDAHILLYAIVKRVSYNWRSVSTLVAENFMGELAERSQNNHGVPDGNALPVEMKKISELHCMRLNPNRSFQMKTFKSRSYEIPQDIGTCIADEKDPGPSSADKNTQPLTTDMSDVYNDQTEHEDVTKSLSVVQVRDHEFDKRKGAKQAKHGKISRWNEQPKGVQPVRYHYKVDETKILPSLRLGISEAELEHL